MLFGCSTSSYPTPDNTSFAEDMITQLYSDDEISNLLCGYKNGIYNNLRDLDGKYQIECIRDPREYNEHYMPYVVIMSESRKKVILFFRPFEDAQNGAGDIVCCISTESFLSKDEMKQTLSDLEDANATWSEWVVLLEKYECGITKGARYHETYLAVKEGVYGVRLCRDDSFTTLAQQIDEMVFYSDDILMKDPEHPRTDGWDPWLILPIDKA